MSDANPYDKPETLHLSYTKKTIKLSGDYQPKPQKKPTQTTFPTSVTHQKRVALFILGQVERVDITHTQTIILGRFDPRRKSNDQIDLTDYGAVDKGVSRIHCKVTFHNGSIFVTDLGSANGTFVAGDRLEPHQPQQGEDLVLGCLPVHIMAAR